MQDGRLVFEPLAQLAPKADTVYRVRVQGLQPATSGSRCRSTPTTSQQPIRREESTRVFGDQ